MVKDCIYFNFGLYVNDIGLYSDQGLVFNSILYLFHTISDDETLRE